MTQQQNDNDQVMARYYEALEDTVKNLIRKNPEVFAMAGRRLLDGDPDTELTMPLGYSDAALRRRKLAQRLWLRYGDEARERYWQGKTVEGKTVGGLEQFTNFSFISR